MQTRIHITKVAMLAGVMALTGPLVSAEAEGPPLANESSLGGLGGISSNASIPAVLESGFPAPLAGVFRLALGAAPSPMSEVSSGLLSAWLEADDGSTQPLAPGDVQWAPPVYPFTAITTAGVISAGAVYADAGGTVTGVYAGVTGTVSLVVRDFLTDNYGSYAGDGIHDAWQVGYFGEENPDALPGVDPDNDSRNNHDEYVAGTAPNDGSSYLDLWIRRVPGVDQMDVLYYPRLAFRTYEVERAANLTDGVWIADFDYDESVNDATCTVRDLNTHLPAAFYRVNVTKIQTNCGSFVQVPLPTLSDQRGHSVALADLNADGTFDAVVGYSGTAQVLLTTLAGSQPILTDTGQRLGTGVVYGVAVGDLDGDKDADVFAAGADGGRIWYNDGTGTFTGGVRAVTNIACTAAAIGDLNGDGHMDLFVSRGSAPLAFTDLVLTNNGSCVFSVVNQPAFILDRSYGVVLGDLDNDGDLDAYVANSVANRCYQNDGHANFTLWGADSRIDDSRGVAIADMNDDGWLDVVVANAWPGPSMVYLNRTGGVLEPFPLGAWMSDALGVGVADFDGDGRPDVVLAGWEDNALWFNVNGTNFVRSTQSFGYDLGQSVAVGDVNRDAAADFVIVNYDTTNLLWLNHCQP